MTYWTAPGMNPSKLPKPQRVKVVAAREFGVTAADLEGRTRTGECCKARAIVWKLLRQYSRRQRGIVALGKLFNRTHGTVLCSVRHLNKTLPRSPELQQKFNNIKSELYENQTVLQIHKG